jgi:TM2 domain-containing membrane protein YozV
MPYCSNCGKEIQEGIKFCKHCGATTATSETATPAPPPPPPPPVYHAAQQVYQEPLKNEGITALASAIIPGAGQIYVGKVKRGIALLIGNVILWMVSGILFWFLAWVPMVVLWAWNIYDAYNLAKQYNQAVRATGRPPADWDTAI